MAIENYQRQVTGRNVTMPAGRRTSSLASALGGGLEMAGQALGKVADVANQVADARAEADYQIAMKEKDRRQAALAAMAAGRMAELSVELDSNEKDLPEYSAPGSVGYAKARGAQIDQAFDTVLADIDDPEVRQRLAPAIANQRAQYKVRAQDYEDKTFRAWQGDNVNRFLDTAANGLRRAPDGRALDQGLSDLDAMVGAMKLDGRSGPMLLQVGKAQLTTGYLDGMLEKGGYDDVNAILASGKLDGVLPPEAIKQYGRMADAGKQAAERKAELDAAERQHAAREALKVLNERIETDSPPSASEWSAGLAAAKAAGVPDSELLQYGKKAEDGIATEDLRQRSTPVLEASVQQLRAQRDAGGLSRSDRTRLEAGEAELNKRGGEAAKRLDPLLKGGPEQRMQAIGQLRGMPMGERWRVAEAAGNPKAALLANIPAEAAAWAVQGQIVRREKPDVVLPPISGTIKTRKDQDAVVDKELQRILGPELYKSMGGVRGAMIDGALDIMAGRQDNWNPASFDKGVRIMMGATARGDGSWQGGYGTVFGRKIELPPKWNETEFARQYGRYGFEGALYSDGTPAKPADIKANFRLELVEEPENGDSWYTLQDSRGRQLMRKLPDGRFVPYILPVPARPGAR